MRAAFGIGESLPRDFVDFVENGGVQHGWLVDLEDEFEIVVDFPQAMRKFLVERREFRSGRFASALEDQLKLLQRGASFNSFTDEIEAAFYQLELPRIEFFRLNQNVFAHPNLAEIVKQRGITNFFHLLARKPCRFVFAGLHGIHSLGKTESERRDAERMSGGRRIALFDRCYGSANESFEEPLDFVVQLAVFIGHSGLR